MADFYTACSASKVSDTNEKGLVFLRFGADHHSFVLARMPAEDRERQPGRRLIQQISMEVADLDSLKRIAPTLAKARACSGRSSTKAPAATTPSIFEDPEAPPAVFSDMTRSAGTARAPARAMAPITVED